MGADFLRKIGFRDPFAALAHRFPSCGIHVTSQQNGDI